MKISCNLSTAFLKVTEPTVPASDSPMFESAVAPLTRPSPQRDHVVATNPIYIGIVTAHSLAARHLAEVIKSNNMVPVILADGAKSAAVFPAHVRVVILVDLWGLPLSSSEYLEAFVGAIPQSSFLAMDHSRNEIDIVRILRAGFAGFISHDEVPYLLEPAIRAVVDGRVWISRDLMRCYMDPGPQRSTVCGTGVETLTARESQVLDFLRRRYSNKEMASFLRISESTIKFHVSNVLMKLNVSDRRALGDKETFSDGKLMVLNKFAKKSAAGTRQMRISRADDQRARGKSPGSATAGECAKTGS